MNTEISVQEVIISRLARRGKGEKHSPIREILQVYTKDGELIAEKDPMPETFVAYDLIHFSRWLKQMNFDPDKIDDLIVNKWLDSIEESK